jgi:protein LSM14
LCNSGGNSSVSWRGRGRGRDGGILNGAVQFIEDFDFTAMNEKFNKDEVWGQLGKGESKDNLEDREEREPANGNTEERSLGQSSISFQVSSRKPTYTKDDFFDSISCDALDRRGRSERTKFSEQRKIDTQTFGSYSLRSSMGRGGRGGRGYRGNIKGYHYSGRGN